MDCSHRWYSNLSSSYTCKVLCTYRKNHFSHPWYSSHYIQNCFFYPVFVCCMLPVFSEDSCWLYLSFFFFFLWLHLLMLPVLCTSIFFVLSELLVLFLTSPPSFIDLLHHFSMLDFTGRTCNLPNCILNTFHALIFALPHIPEKLPFKS